MKNNRDKEIIKKLTKQIHKLTKMLNEKDEDVIKYVVCKICKKDLIPDTEYNKSTVPNIYEEEYNLDEDEEYYSEDYEDCDEYNLNNK